MHRRVAGALLAVSIGTALTVGTIAAPPARAAGIVTHAWMALDGISWARDIDLKVLLLVNAEQVRAGAEFPDGGYWTRALGIPGGDYGEEAHWQRFVDAYAAQISGDPNCVDLADPFGPCAPMIAHMMGVAAHGYGDEVFDWLFEPSAPGHLEDEYLPTEWQGIVGSGGIEAQMDMVAIARHRGITGPTPPIPDTDKIVAAFASVGRTDIAANALPIGEQFLEAERAVETDWASRHVAGVEWHMPWAAANLHNAPGGVVFAAQAIGAHYDWRWDRLNRRAARTEVAITSPLPSQRTVPYAGWTGSISPGSHDGNTGSANRIAAVLSSALPYRARAGGGPFPDELPPGAMRVRDVTTDLVIAPRTGYPRAVPYGAESGTHTIAFQPATDLRPCRWYQVEITDALLDAHGAPVVPTAWRFRTSGCVNRVTRTAIRGTATCALQGNLGAIATGPDQSVAFVRGTFTDCFGGQDGTPNPGARLPIASARFALGLRYDGTGCDAIAARGLVTIQGSVTWLDRDGNPIGASAIDEQLTGHRGLIASIDFFAHAFPNYALALRLDPRPATCTPGSITRVDLDGKADAFVPL